jgi:insulysin
MLINRPDNYRASILATFKYLSLLRSSSFPAWYQKELSTISQIRFRFAEKKRPDDYAVWITEHMAWPVERDMVLSAPQLVFEWDEIEDREAEVRKVLDSLSIDRGRAVIMARVEDLNNAFADKRDLKWEYEPWYGTGFLVEKFDDALITEVSFNHSCFMLRSVDSSLPGQRSQ